MAIIDRTTYIYGENIVNNFFTFDNEATWLVSNGASALHDANTFFNGRRSLRILSSIDITQSSTAQIANQATTINEAGNYIVQFQVKTSSNVELTGNCEVFVNSTLNTTINFTMPTSDLNKWIGQYAYISGLNKGDSVEFRFTLNGVTGSGLPSTVLYVDGFGLYYNDRNLILPPNYSKPEPTDTAWQKRVDATTQSLTASSENTISFAGTSTSNGGFELLDSTSKVIPVNENDAMLSTITFDVNTPATTGQYLTVSFIVNGNIQKSKVFAFLKSSGTTEKVSFSFPEVVDTAFKNNGGTFSINPSVALDIRNKEIETQRTHKAI